MRQLKLLAFTAILVLSSLMIAAGQNLAGQNRIRAENASGGTTDWQILTYEAGAYAHQIEGYASRTSVNINETIQFHLNVNVNSVHVRYQIYRLGFYDGLGAKQVYPLNGGMSDEITVAHQEYPTPDPVTGLAECNWPANAEWLVPNEAVSGVYLVKLTNGTVGSYISFVVREDGRQSDVLFQRSVTTDQAYNNYPGARFPDADGNPTEDPRNGKSLYEFNTRGTVLSLTAPRHQAKKVSFNRPFGVLSNPDLAPSTGIKDTAGGSLFTYDFQMIRWLEGNSFDVTYCTDIDTENAVEDSSGRFSPGRHKAFLSVGHDEYWSWNMRDNIEQARNRPVSQQPLNLGFFGGNTCYWQIRFESSSNPLLQPADKAKRTIVSYKDHALDADGGDPDYGNAAEKHLTTNLWRQNKDIHGVISKPAEDELVGVMSTLGDPYPVLCCGWNRAVISADSPKWITQGASWLRPLDGWIDWR